jgi:hypothetical protein
MIRRTGSVFAVRMPEGCHRMFWSSALKRWMVTYEEDMK